MVDRNLAMGTALEIFERPVKQQALCWRRSIRKSVKREIVVVKKKQQTLASSDPGSNSDLQSIRCVTLGVQCINFSDP